MRHDSTGRQRQLGTVFKVTTNGVLGRSLPILEYLMPSASGVCWPGMAILRMHARRGVQDDAGWNRDDAGFVDSIHGVHPQAALVLGPDGNFTGTTHDGGTNNLGEYSD
jgi:hypothetical protein